ncbi:MAG: M56 family metallopeptidase [Defluviitaleaceae bacterium]|nr:M56 family metallopeptidase [Defluviitaleaceae bacterium]
MAEALRTILIMSATGSILALLLFLIKPLGRHRLPKSTQYYLWLVVIASLLIPVSRLITLPTNQAAPMPNIPTITETVTRFVITQAEETQRLEVIAPLANTNPPAYISQRQEIQSPIAIITTYFVLVYPFGVLVLLLYYAIHYAIFIGLYRRRNLPATPGAKALLASLCQGKPPRLYYNQLAETPMLFGIFRPAIILPYQEYTRDEMQVILAHELTHLRRKDVLIKWLTLLATALHWYNPIVWLVSREIDRTCELSCDEAVIRSLDGHGRRHYGNTLILVAANPKTPRAITSATMSEDKKNLKERLGAIMKNKRPARYVLILSALLIIASVGLAACLGSGSGNTPPNLADEYEYPVGPEDNYEEYNPDEPDTTPSPATTLDIQMAHAADAPLSSFDSYYEIDYRQVHLALWGGDLDWLTINMPAAIWANAPLHDFQIIGLELGHVDDGITANAIHVYYEIDVLEGPLVINWFFTAGLFPNNGISFTDAQGVRRFFAIQAGYGHDEAVPFTLIEFENGDYLFIWDASGHEGQGEEFPSEALDSSVVYYGDTWIRLIWDIEPDLGHANIRRCNCGRFVDQEWRVISPLTGQLTGEIEGGHGGPSPCWVYDPNLRLFGNAGYHWGYNTYLGMHTIEDFEANMDGWDLQHSGGLIAVQAVDSTLRYQLSNYMEMHEEMQSYAQDWWSLPEEAFTGRFALMYNRRLITDFVFTGAPPWWHRFNTLVDGTWEFMNIDFIPMEINGAWGFVSREGTAVLPSMFENLIAIDGNRFFARFDGMYGILDARATFANN